MEPPRPAHDAPAEELLELVHQVQRELLLRDEAPTGPWVEESTTDLRTGAKAGWYYPVDSGGGVAFRTERETASFAHVHVGPGPGALPRAIALSEVLIESLPGTIQSVSVGFTGLTTEQEQALTSRLSERPGSTVIQRFAMERELRSRDGEGLPPVPDALTLVPIRDISLDALSLLDQRAFRGTTDELLVGTELEEYRRVLTAYLSGTVGRFLDEASTALYRAEPPTLAGAILACEKSARRAVFQDFMVDPSLRGRGYGAYLLRWAMRALWALGYERVRLWVSASNEPARRLYDSVGFSVTHSAVIYRWDRTPLPPQPQSAR
ncbi:MAG: GNAT family N-acetyltransferase [Thermoplasmata archaeon]|nr:GNAT family N-acetyltransferase [Thermoplasmata archaeon]